MAVPDPPPGPPAELAWAGIVEVLPTSAHRIDLDWGVRARHARRPHDRQRQWLINLVLTAGGCVAGSWLFFVVGL